MQPHTLLISNNLGHHSSLFVEPQTCLRTSKVYTALRKKNNRHSGVLEKKSYSLTSAGLGLRGEHPGQKAPVN